MPDVESPGPRCPTCGYLLHGLTTPRCPECGRDFGTMAQMKRVDELAAWEEANRRAHIQQRLLALAGMLMILLGMSLALRALVASLRGDPGLSFPMSALFIIGTVAFILYRMLSGEPLYSTLLGLGVMWLLIALFSI